jgi:type IV pilus assembly protein PilA
MIDAGGERYTGGHLSNSLTDRNHSMFIRLNQALDASRARREEGEKGFTLIELLVVVLIIGVLSAIAIPIFLNQQKTAKDSAARTDLTSLKTAVVSYQVDNPTDVDITEADLATVGFVKTTGTTFTGLGLNPTTAWSVTATATGGTGKVFTVTSTGGVTG